MYDVINNSYQATRGLDFGPPRQAPVEEIPERLFYGTIGKRGYTPVPTRGKGPVVYVATSSGKAGGGGPMLMVPPSVQMLPPYRVDPVWLPGQSVQWQTLPAGLSDTLDPNAPDPALYQPRALGSVTGTLWIMDKITAKNAAYAIQTRINLGWTDDLDKYLLKYLPVKKFAIIIFERGTLAEHMRYIVQAMRQPAGIITTEPIFNSRIDRLSADNGFVYAFIKDADTLTRLNDLEGRMVKLDAGKMTWSLAATAADADQLNGQTVFLCQSKPWKERCKTVGLYNPDAPRPFDETPGAPPMLLPPPPPPPPDTTSTQPSTPVYQPPYYQPTVDPAWLPDGGKVIPFIPAPGGPVYTLPPTMAGQPGDDGVALPYDAVCTGFTTKSAWKAAGQPRCQTMVESPPFQVSPGIQPYDPGTSPPIISLPTMPGQQQQTQPGGSTTSGGTTAAPSDPNLIFGFPKQQVLLAAAAIAGFMLLKK